MSAATDFRAAVERADIEAAIALLAPDIVFHSPATFHPFIGRDTVSSLLRLVFETFEDFRYTDELEGVEEGTHALIFRAAIDGKEIEGIDLLRLDEQDDAIWHRHAATPLRPRVLRSGDGREGRCGGAADHALLRR